MSTITGSCGASQAQLLFERGMQEHQAQRLQESRAQELASIQQGQQGSSLGLSPTLVGQAAPVEPNKGVYIDVYA